MTIRAAIVTTSRADWNALGMVDIAMRGDGGFNVGVVRYGDHDLGGRGLWQIENPKSQDRASLAAEITRSTAVAISKGVMMADVAIILGDRWDALAAAMGASMAGVPIAHLSGGDVTEGSLDNRYRDAISALATWHFPTHAGADVRLLSMGYPKDRVFCVGSPAIDRIKATPLLPTGQVFMELGLAHCESYCVLNWQPETAATDPNAGLRAALGALETYRGGIVAVGQNDDVRAPEAAELIRQWAKPRANVSIIPNMRPQLYLSALANADFLIGNSSSGIYEAPTLSCPVINVGDRQRGRPLSPCIMNADDAPDIRAAITDAIDGVFGAPIPLFGDGNAAVRIVEVLKTRVVSVGSP